MKKTLLFLLFTLLVNAQEVPKKPHQLYAKGNLAFAPVGVINLALEYQLSDQYTIQADGFISPWKKFAGKHAQLYMAHLEGRYYFDAAFHKWYIGINGGFGLFDITKWNYFNTNYFQRGFNFMIGATIGYQFHWKDRWNFDVFLRGGNSQGYYHGYGEQDVAPHFFRYENAEHWNKSGEWVPYGGGVMITYKLF